MRKNKRHITSIALAALLSLTVALPAAAKPPHAKGKAKGHYKAPSQAQQYLPQQQQRSPLLFAEQRISYSQAKSIAMRRYPGAQHLDTFLNGDVYTVVLRLPNTKKVKVKIDAVTGRTR